MNDIEIVPQTPRPRRFFRPSLWLWLALLLLPLLGWQWWAARVKLAEARNELVQHLAENNRKAREIQLLLDKSIEETRILQGKVGALEAKVDEFQGQADALRSLYQEAAASHDDVLIAEVEQNLNIAVQQLQLSGNAQAATVALAAADERLARQGSLQFLPLRRTLARDLERLRATPSVDVPGMNLRLEYLITRVDKLPLILAFSAPPPQTSPPVAEPDAAPWWRRLLRESWREIRGMVRIQRFDRPDPVLLTPNQTLILRENIKLRLLNARLALLSRDQWTFRNELEAARLWIGQYFEAGDKSVAATLQTLQQLAATGIVVEFPSLNDSLAALQTLKAGKERR
jgi:uroporphyrin-3 C-methyltransferase